MSNIGGPINFLTCSNGFFFSFLQGPRPPKGQRGSAPGTRHAFWIVGEEGGETNGVIKEVIVDGDDGDLGAYV